jgi:hypothetical protein
VRTRALLVLLALGLAAPTVATAGSQWVHWQGRWFSCWVPTSAWQVVEGQNGLDVSSSTGTDVVTYQYATNAPAPVTPAWVAALIFRYQNEDLHPLSGVRIVARSGVSGIAGGQRQVFEWTGIRHYRTGGSEAAHGIVVADSFANYATGAYAYEAYAEASPAASWRSHRALLDAIRAHITFYGHE